MKSRTVVVLGNARSGTSMVAGILEHMGVEMDSTIDHPDVNAPKGYFESDEAHSINTAIFERAWNGEVEFELDPHFYPPPQAAIDAQAELVAEEVQSFAARFAEADLWGFKNPKTCLTFELFRPHLPDPAVVITFRNPLANALSLHRVYELPMDRSLQITMRYNEALMDLCSDESLPKLIVNFDEARRTPERLVADLDSFLGLGLTRARRDEVLDVVVPPPDDAPQDCSFRL